MQHSYEDGNLHGEALSDAYAYGDSVNDAKTHGGLGKESDSDQSEGIHGMIES